MPFYWKLCPIAYFLLALEWLTAQRFNSFFVVFFKYSVRHLIEVAQSWIIILFCVFWFVRIIRGFLLFYLFCLQSHLFHHFYTFLISKFNFWFFCVAWFSVRPLNPFSSSVSGLDTCCACCSLFLYAFHIWFLNVFCLYVFEVCTNIFFFLVFFKLLF